MAAYMDRKDLANTAIDTARAMSIADGVHRVRDRIARAESVVGRDTGSVQLLAATKTRDVGEIMAAIDAGVRMIGENRPQEVVAKADGIRRLCAERGITVGCEGSIDTNSIGKNDAVTSATHIPFHLIGQLQSNKIGKILPVVDVIESVDSLELAERISRRAVTRGVTVGVLLEVNESGEVSKSGCDPVQAASLAQRIGVLDGIELRGLMTVGAHVSDERVIRSGFAHLRHCRDQILESGMPGTSQCCELSMGMTNDLEFAITEGSTIVRVGTAIFGERSYK